MGKQINNIVRAKKCEMRKYLVILSKITTLFLRIMQNIHIFDRELSPSGFSPNALGENLPSRH